jgi:hypothetical protein
MEGAPENSKELSRSAHVNGMNEWMMYLLTTEVIFGMKVTQTPFEIVCALKYKKLVSQANVEHSCSTVTTPSTYE